MEQLIAENALSMPVLQFIYNTAMVVLIIGTGLFAWVALKW